MFVKRGEYPNPQFQRKSYVCLNGKWDFAIYSTREDLFGNGASTLSKKITVPFCPESKCSGVAYTDFINYCKYKRTVKISLKKLQDKRLLLHFGAVDYKATVLVNGEKVGEHIGGYVPFAVDITDFVMNGKNVLTVLVEDEKLYDQPRGKQSYKKESFGCFYTRVTGIWQTVWLEYVPKTRVECVQFYPDIVACSVTVKGQTRGAGICRITISYRGKRVGVAECESDGSFECNCTLLEKHLWKLGQGELYDVKISFEKDEISSYFGLREVKYEGMRFLLNGKSVMQKLVLDQGYYPDGIYTPATVKAYKEDIQRAMRLGFNGARPHQKVFEPRYLYECDKAGFLLWGEYPSWGLDFSSLETLPLIKAEWQAVVERDFNHPCIALWCPLNEVWGNWADDGKQPDLAYIKELYRFAKSLDNTRPCIDVSGGYHCGETDVFDFHCYEEVSRIRQVCTQLDESDMLEVDLLYPKNKEDTKAYFKGVPVQLSECGGITISPKPTKQSTEILYLKKSSFCGECGSALTRNPKWATREKWLCKNGCKCKRYIDDKAIVSAIKKATLSVEGNKSTQPPQAIYKRTQEILRHTNEIARLTSTQNPSFAVGKKLIFECVNLKFQACKEDKSVYGNSVLRLAENFCVECIPKIVSKIFIYGNGGIKVEFKDGQEYVEEVENAS